MKGWNKMTGKDKALTIIRLITSILVIVFALLQLLKIWDKAIYVAAPLVGVVLLVQGIQEFKDNRSVALVSFGCSIFIFICAIVVFLSL
ncbi:MAG: DUF3953 domain-containing protein [Bacilli bacterium]|nr:DUF3953 domain-containing protein [Bacilli bacterium]